MKTYSDLQGDGGSNVLEQVVAQRRQVAERLANVRHVVAVMSGKGGVGKSTVTASLASVLAHAGQRVGIVDADLNGPSIPALLALPAAPPRVGTAGLVPPESSLGVRVMSSGLYLESADDPLRYQGPREDPFTWRPTAEATTLREFLGNTVWGTLDWLLLDLPPGAERLPALLGLLPRLAGAVVVTLASPLSLASVRKSITSARDHDVRILGLVENMAASPCEACGSVTPFHGEANAVERVADELELPWLGALPMDPQLVAAAEHGTAVLTQDETSPTRRAIQRLADSLTETLEEALAPQPEGNER
jgi:ATP-binding protein involved in chromosome partitioning